jgi:hypothetical protein
VVGDVELFAQAVQCAGGRHHRHQRQEHGDDAARVRWREGRQAHGRRRQPRRAGPDLLADDVELYVVELSSFQLETTIPCRWWPRRC